MATAVPRPRLAAPAPRTIGLVNWIGVWTLYSKEVARFVKVSTQTIWAPVVTVLLFLAIFSLALGRGATVVGGLPFEQFLAPGLVVMAMIQKAFANTSSSMMIGMAVMATSTRFPPASVRAVSRLCGCPATIFWKVSQT